MKRIAQFALLFALASSLVTGCHAAPVQASPGQNAVLTWGQSPSCTTSAPCPSYQVNRESVASASTPCDPLTSNNWQVVGTAATPNATSWTDNTITATGYYCWSVQAQQGTPLVTGPGSAASNNGVAMLVTEPPLAPTAVSTSAQAAAVVQPALPLTVNSAGEVAVNAPLRLSVQIEETRH